MKVLLINGSPRKEGNTFLALSEVATALEQNGVETRIIQLGNKAVQGCIACNKCNELGRCVFKDKLYEDIRENLQDIDGLIVGSPVYYAGPNGSLCAILDRVFIPVRICLHTSRQPQLQSADVAEPALPSTG